MSRKSKGYTKMDPRVWSIYKIHPIQPSKKFEGTYRLITVKNIDTGKSAKIWLDSRFARSFHKFDNFHEGDLVTNLKSIPNKPADTLNADNVQLTKCVHKKQIPIFKIEDTLPRKSDLDPVNPKDYPTDDEVNAMKGDQPHPHPCEECTDHFRKLKAHLLKGHQISLFNDDIPF